MQKYLLHQYFIFFLILTPAFTSAQTHVVSGQVKSAETKSPVASCTITIFKSARGTTTDANGNFRITIPPNINTERLIISMSGYATDTIPILPDVNDYKIFLRQTENTLTEVVITGVSKVMLVRESPVAVVAVSAKAIEQTIESNIIDALVKNVNGLSAVKTGPNISKPFIRGLGYNRVLTLYDGIRQEGQQWGDEHGIEVDAYNIGKAEVIKGPSSIMYGSDAVAGVVSFIPAMPPVDNEKLHGKYFTEYQANNGLTGNGLRLTYSQGNWGYALRGSYRIAKNYTNSIDKRVYNTGFREANASATVQHSGSKGFSNLNLTLYNNLQGIPDGSRDSLTRKFTKQIFEADDDDIRSRPIVSQAELNAYQLSPLHQNIQHYRIYSNNHYKTGKGDIDFTIAFQQNIRSEYNHPTLPKQAGMQVRLNTYNYGIRYNAPTVFETAISVGVNGMFQKNISRDATDFPIPDYNLFDAGAYVFAKWKKDKWTISGGARYDIRNLKGNEFYTNNHSITHLGKQVVPPDTAGAYLQFPAFNKIFNGTSLGIGATYQFNKHINLKVNIAKGYRAPGITEFASNGLDPGAHIIYLGNRNFVPEFSLQEDVGADLRFKDFSASASLFNNNIQHYIYLSQLTNSDGDAVLDAQGNKTFQYQQSSAHLYGMEFMFNLHPSFLNGFSFNNSFSFVRGYNRKQDFKGKGIYGEYLPLIPPMKVLTSIHQNIKTTSKVFKEISAAIESEFNASQNRYMALNHTETSTPAYTLLNASMNAKINYTRNNDMQFLLQINNLLDKSYQSNLSRLKYFEYYSHSPNGHQGMYNMGRNICIKAIVSF